MPFYPADAEVPHGLQTELFRLVPLVPAHNPLDYDAVMATQETLRLRGANEWPRPDFTPEENLVDLEMHEADFQARRGFTYTVQNVTGDRCLGCVYVYPLAETLRRRDADEATMAAIGEGDAYVWHWTRAGSSEAFDRALVAAIIPWLRNDFAFTRIVALAWANDPRQPAALQEADLTLTWSFPVGDTTALYFS